MFGYKVSNSVAIPWIRTPTSQRTLNSVAYRPQKHSLVKARSHWREDELRMYWGYTFSRDLAFVVIRNKIDQNCHNFRNNVRISRVWITTILIMYWGYITFKSGCLPNVLRILRMNIERVEETDRKYYEYHARITNVLSMYRGRIAVVFGKLWTYCGCVDQAAVTY